ncbi:MAG: 3-oxoacid CoA-transferase subunit A [Fusobacterium sp.]|nr:3-oxoacid CoA-transferase subunit A [Fusobacterium sp.]
MISKFIKKDKLKDLIKDDMTIMVGSFLDCGSPNRIIDELLELGVKNLTLICNDTAFPDRGVGRMIVAKQFKKAIVSHVGTNPETGRQMNEGELEVVLTPQGTLAEQVRTGGAGLGGFLTPTGLGTPVAEGKQQIELDGKTYLLEKSLKADVAILGATLCDKKGNLWYEGSSRNFNPLMATAADVVIVEAEKIVEVGEIAPENVVTPHIFVDYIVDFE